MQFMPPISSPAICRGAKKFSTFIPSIITESRGGLEPTPRQDQCDRLRPSAANLGRVGLAVARATRQRGRILWGPHSCPRTGTSAALVFVLRHRGVVYAPLRSPAQSPHRDLSQSVAA